MSKKIVGVTVGTTISPKLLEKKLKPVKSVNGMTPDENGNVEINEAPPIECNSTGEVIAVNDSAERPLRGLSLYGKTIQNGTPTPESPVELESVGADGNMAVTMCGKNLVNVFTDDLNYRRDGTKQTSNKNVVNEDGSVTVNMPSSATYGVGFIKSLPAGKPVTISYDIESIGNGTMLYLVIYDVNNYQSALLNHATEYEGAFKRTFIPTVSSRYLFGWHVKGGTAPCGAKITNLQLEYGSTVTEYETGKETQSLTVSTPNGLPGIPVSSGGNYIDENGQMWICDEIDFASGKYIRRIGILDKDSGWTYYNNDSNDFAHLKPALLGFTYDSFDMNKPNRKEASNLKCNCLPYMAGGPQLTEGTFSVSDRFYVKVSGLTTTTQYKDWMEANDFKMTYFLETPIETDLTAEEIAQYSVLHTNYPNTTVYNDSGAGMSVGYVADTKLYIDKKFAELASAIVSNT